MKPIRYLLAGIMLSGLVSCTEKELAPEFNDGIKPAAPSGIRVENVAGGAVISYSLPLETDLGGVEARYTLASGKEVMVKSSEYTRQIKVEGFADAKNYPIIITSFDKGGNYSDPVTIEITPLNPPVRSISESMTLTEDWGGISLHWVNDSKAPVALLVLADTTGTGRLVQVDAVYTSIRIGQHATRGLKNIERRFGVIVRDRWENYSDTIFATLTPLEEVQLDRTRFRPVSLPTDRQMENMQMMFNPDIASICIGTNPDNDLIPLPEHFTFDLGVTAKLSRFKLYHYNFGSPYDFFLYYNFNLRFFEVWGATSPNPDGSWDGWTLLKDCEVVKPSGLPVGPSTNAKYTTQEDIESALRGFEFSVPADAPPVRYIRINMKQAWLKSKNTGSIGYLELFGRVDSD